MLNFKKIQTATGTAYQAFSEDKSLVYTVYRQRASKNFARVNRLYPWEFEIIPAKELVPGLFVPDYDRTAIKRKEGVDSRSEAYTYCQAFDASDAPLYSSKRNLEAWDAVYPELAK